jgi:hypothetical protein
LSKKKSNLTQKCKFRCPFVVKKPNLVPREETTTYFLEEVESPEPEVPRGLRPSSARGGLFMPEKTLGAGIQQSLDLLYGGPVLRRSKVPTLEGSSNNNQDQKQHREQQQHQLIQQRPSTSNHHKAAMKTSNKYLDFGGSLDMGNRKGSSVENFVAKSSKHLQQMISSVAAASVIPATQSAPPVVRRNVDLYKNISFNCCRRARSSTPSQLR